MRKNSLNLATYPWVARRLKVKLQTVYKWRDRHPDFPPAVTCPTCGTHPVVDLDAVLKWQEQR